MEAILTVKVKHPTIASEFIVINEADFDSTKHERYEEPKQQKKKKGADDPPTPPPAEGEASEGANA